MQKILSKNHKRKKITKTNPLKQLQNTQTIVCISVLALKQVIQVIYSVKLNCLRIHWLLGLTLELQELVIQINFHFLRSQERLDLWRQKAYILKALKEKLNHQAFPFLSWRTNGLLLCSPQCCSASTYDSWPEMLFSVADGCEPKTCKLSTR